jgi:hypothetical protein
MSRLHTIAVGSLLVTIGCTSGTRAPTQEELEQAQAHASVDDLRRDLAILAADSLGGRGTPSPGLDMALRYVEAAAREIGLEPGGEDGSYSQSWLLRTHDRTPDAVTAVATVGGSRLALTAENATHLVIGVTAADLPVSAPLAFVGFGIHSPEHSWDDYAATDVAGKAVIVMDGAPWDVDVSIPFGYDKALHKAVEAYQHGAKAVVYATDRYGQPDQPPATAFLMGFATEPIAILETDQPGHSMVPPIVFVSYETANRLLGNGTIQAYQRQSRESMESVGFDIPEAQFELSLASAGETVSTRNLIAIFPGADRQLRDEYVVYGAHIDHVGTGHALNGDSIYNGADDNASGSAALLAIARSFAALPEDARPKRSIAFVWFSGEELGLFGSSAYSDHPAVPFAQTVANLNLDMVGRAPGDTVFLHDFEMGDLEAVAFELAPEVGVAASPFPWPDFRLLYYSDHMSFVANQVPAMFFFSGFHPDYHMPSDEVGLINFATMEKIARLAFRTGVALANDEARPAWKAPPYFSER